MFKVAEIIGNPVISHVSNHRISNVKEALLDSDHQRVVAFVVSGGTTKTGDMRVLPWVGIRNITPDEIVAHSSTMIVEANKLFALRRTIEHHNCIMNLEVQTLEGTSLGVISDILFDEKTGIIIGYETSLNYHISEVDDIASFCAKRSEHDEMIIKVPRSHIHNRNGKSLTL